MKNFISFKRFVTFGLGLGMFMSASSGFAQVATATAVLTDYVIDSNGAAAGGNTLTVGKNKTSTAGTINITGRAPDGTNGLYIGEGTAVNTRIDVTGAIYGPANSAVPGGHNYSIAANGGITAQDLTTRGQVNAAGSVTTQGNITGKLNSQLSGGVMTGNVLQSTAIGNGAEVGANYAVQIGSGVNNASNTINIGGAGNGSAAATQAVNITGSNTNLNATQTFNVNAGSQINLNSNTVIGGTNKTTTTTGLTTNITTSNTNINSAGSVSVTVNGGSGTMNVNAAQVVTGTQQVNGLATFKQGVNVTGEVTANAFRTTTNTVYINGTNGNITSAGAVITKAASIGSGGAVITGVTQAQGGLVVSGATPSGYTLKVNGSGSVTQGATDINGNVANGSIIANGTDLIRITTNAANTLGALDGSSSGVHNNGVSGAEASIATGTGSVTQQLGSVVSTTAAAVNSTNARVNDVEIRTTAQSYTAPAVPTALGTTEFASNVTVSGTTTTDSLIVDGTTTTGSINNGGNIINGGEVNTKDLVVTGATTTNGIDNGGKTITNMADGVAVTDAATVGQVNAVQTNLDAEVNRATGVEAGLQSTKADKTQVTTDIATAKGAAIAAAAIDATTKADAAQATAISSAAIDATTKAGAALTSANGYTDGKITTLTTTVNNNATTAAAATAQVQTNLDATNGVVAGHTTDIANLQSTKADKIAVANEVARVDGRIDTTNAALASETVDRIAGDAHSVAVANTYTDNKVATETARAQAAEAVLSKEVKQVGAMAMAAAAVAGATPTQGKTSAVSVAVGTYEGQNAIAFGVVKMIKENTKLYGTISAVSGGKVGAAVGASFSW